MEDSYKDILQGIDVYKRQPLGRYTALNCLASVDFPLPL